MKKAVSNYDKNPAIQLTGYENETYQGLLSISEELLKKIHLSKNKKVVLVVDAYHGVHLDQLMKDLMEHLPIHSSHSVQSCHLSEQELNHLLAYNITDDRVFGVMSCHKINQFFDPKKVAEFQQMISAIKSGLVLVYGIGAAHIIEGDLLIYADMARWEIQQRMRRGEVTNWCSTDYDLDILRRYKRAYFIDWRVLDRHKQDIWDKVDYFLDSHLEDRLKMISSNGLKAGLSQAVQQPFRVVPFFDPGPWGGQWMKETCDLDPSKPNYAWCFDCVPEENSLLIQSGDVIIETPSINLVFQHPGDLLGPKVYARFGKEFPIRFDFLDTMDGGNLSLQVHPTTDYIKDNFGMSYTQDESYYILDAKEDATVYLGIKEGVGQEDLLNALETAQKGETPFDADAYINKFPAKKHDHFLIPAGTIHCSGKNAMVLEVSATPYIFTFKLWDWGRLGMDGLPRPIHLNHGKKVIQLDRTTDWVKKNLVSPIDVIREENGVLEEKTGLHELEFIETRRHWSKKRVLHHTSGGVHVLNLVEGQEAIVESPDQLFKPFIVHYAETFIIPACLGSYTIRPHGVSEGAEIATLKAYIRT